MKAHNGIQDSEVRMQNPSPSSPALNAGHESVTQDDVAGLHTGTRPTSDLQMGPEPASDAPDSTTFARDALFFTANDSLLLALDFLAAGDADNARLQIESARTALSNLRALDSHHRPQIINLNA